MWGRRRHLSTRLLHPDDARPRRACKCGAAPVVRGEAVNTATTYGYDSVTMMQETKTTICNIEKA